MSIDVINTLGFIAGSLTTISFLPQVIKAWRSHSVNDLSLITFLALVLGVILWTIYGFLVWDWPIIIANSITFVLITILVFLKIRYNNQEK